MEPQVFLNIMLIGMKTIFLVAPTPDQAYTVQLNYIIYPPHFTASNNTYLPQYQQQVLLYGVLVESFFLLKRSSRYVQSIQKQV
jgi:hypothetical protein